MLSTIFMGRPELCFSPSFSRCPVFNNILKVPSLGLPSCKICASFTLFIACRFACFTSKTYIKKGLRKMRRQSFYSSPCSHRKKAGSRKSQRDSVTGYQLTCRTTKSFPPTTLLASQCLDATCHLIMKALQGTIHRVSKNPRLCPIQKHRLHNSLVEFSRNSRSSPFSNQEFRDLGPPLASLHYVLLNIRPIIVSR